MPVEGSRLVTTPRFRIVCTAIKVISPAAKTVEKRSEELQDMIRLLTEQKLSATKLIDSVEDPIGRAILRRRYIFCDTWKKIAIACGKMSERNAHYIHDQALLDFERIYCGSKAVFSLT